MAIAIVVIVAAIAVELAIAAIPAIQKFGLGFLFTTEWNPVRNIYGILPQIYGTLVSSIVALALAIPMGVGIAIFLNENFVPKSIRVPISFAIELLAAIPSVVYGLWGIFTLTPIMKPVLLWLHQNLGWIPFFSTVPSNRSLLPTILVLTLMILPIVVALSRDALASVPLELRLGAAALGANRWEFILGIMIPAGLSGIVGAAVLALGRAIGETMAAVMLIGNANQIQWSWLAPSSTIAALIANQFSEARGIQVSALLYAALVLMVLTLFVNVVANWFISSFHLIQDLAKQYGNLTFLQIIGSYCVKTVRDRIPSNRQLGLWQPNPLRRKIGTWLLTFGIILGTSIAVLAIGSIFASLIWQGVSRFDVAAFTEFPPPPLDLGGGFRNAIEGTLLMVGIGAGLSAPLGIGTAIYLVEFGRGNALSQWVRFFNGILSGVPSILCGLFVYALVVLTTGTFSAIAGGVALAVVMLPITVRTAEEGLKAVALELREGAYALGASPLQAIVFIILPDASPAIATGVVLSIARASGETAPLLFTALFSQYGFNGLWKPVASMSVLIYNFALSPYPNHQSLAWTAALVVVALILTLSITARFLTRDRL
ncbi:phosphate transport system permease protein PstC [Pseudanabaena sp. lw0831]|nr:phosphate transport system permease protein PstC [Pseudanabaena sp. lw0831]